MAKTVLFLDKERFKTLVDKLSEIKEFSSEHCLQAASFLNDVYGRAHMRISEARKKISAQLLDSLKQKEYISERNGEYSLGMSAYIVIDSRIGCCQYM